MEFEMVEKNPAAPSWENHGKEYPHPGKGHPASAPVLVVDA